MIIEIFILLLGVIAGFLIAFLARDELVVGRKYFRVLIVLSLIGIIGSWLYSYISWVWSFGFILIVSLVSLVKSFDRKWTKKRLK